MEADEERRRFARRLEAFSDIVFGFAPAQSALAMTIPRALGDVPASLANLCASTRRTLWRAVRITAGLWAVYAQRRLDDAPLPAWIGGDGEPGGTLAVETVS